MSKECSPNEVLVCTGLGFGISLAVSVALLLVSWGTYVPSWLFSAVWIVIPVTSAFIGWLQDRDNRKRNENND